MRRRIVVAAILTGALFGALAIPGTPLNRWLVDLLADSVTVPERGASPPPPHWLQAPPLRVAIGAMVSPERTFLDYRTLFETAARLAGRRLELVQRRSYGEVNQLIMTGSVDIAWVCTGAVAELAAAHAATLVVVPEVSGRTTYRSNLVVRQDSRIGSPADLRGAVMAFTDPLSLTGRRVIIDEITRLGATPEAFFGQIFYTHAHDHSIRAVRDGLATAACVDSLVWDHLVRSSPAEIAGLRVVWTSDDFPIPPLVAPVSAERELVARLREILLALASDPAHWPVLRGIGVDRFVPGDADLYFPE